MAQAHGALDAERAKWQAKESELRDRAQQMESECRAARAALEQSQAAAEALQARVVKLETVNGELRRQRRALQEDLRQEVPCSCV